jgi:1-acyl-sn-glycerol-3-phosphate acyltransferase
MRVKGRRPRGLRRLPETPQRGSSPIAGVIIPAGVIDWTRMPDSPPQKPRMNDQAQMMDFKRSLPRSPLAGAPGSAPAAANRWDFPDRRSWPLPKPLAFLRIIGATLSSYFVGYPLTALLVAMGIVASKLGIRSFIRRGVVFWGNLVFWVNGRRLHVYGRRNMSAGKSYLVLANHTSMFDIPALLAVVPDVALVGREKLTRIPVFGLLLKVIHYIPIDTDRIKKAHEAITEAVRKAGQGISIGMFPEGTRSPTGRVQRLKRGFIYVLRASGLDVLPMTIRGTYALKPKRGFTMDPRERIEAFVHPPIPNGELAGLTDEQIMEKVRSVLDNEVRRSE